MTNFLESLATPVLRFLPPEAAAKRGVGDHKAAGRAAYLGCPKSQLPLDEQLRRLESRVKQLESVLYGQTHHSTAIILIKRRVAQYYGVSVRALAGHSHRAEFVWPRYVALWLCETILGASLSSLRDHFARRDYNSLRYAVKSVAQRLSIEPSRRDAVVMLEGQIRKELDSCL